ncbi:heparan-alpha-glucosaminide N-acetyltransferase domain-containing protein [Anaeromyxobacter paludicola]|uniref:Acyltransferase 3 domain-containing protein n=1 Tax=Anaeromyxobacter paludicola TaxID=2918171 RepID=A0ABM7X8H2_9BACT|nr:heparan-alpha-glucosaminide N-acetyltransferase domain-containing protein [Anaeromyxobacter paludicola]BDG08119.1 hypothetical protein AMPC_12320 [Anaeromyxobacter paludicola]
MASPRRNWLDWERGLAVLFMVEVHTLDAWLAPGVGQGLLRDVLLMMGGFAAPSFLFMSGLSQQLADASAARRGVAPGPRLRGALSRALWLLGVAYAFRFAEFVLGGAFRVSGGWRDILRVDILNVIALSLALAALLGWAARGRAAFPAFALATAAIAAAAPLAAAWQHPESRLLDYVYATFPRANFSLVNWSAFLLAGSAVGRLLRDRDRPALLLALGAALFAGGWLGDLLPAVYRHQDFWHTSPAWFAMRLGGVLALTALCQLVPATAAPALSALRTLGRHSLLGYIASIELTYGFWSHPVHRALSLTGTLLGIAAMVAVTWAASAVAERWAAWREGRRPAAPPPPPTPAVAA